MKCPGLHSESYAQYVLGTAPEEERSQIENHLMMGCETCTAELRAYEMLWHQVALQTPVSNPPAGLRKRILREVAGSTGSPWAWLRPAAAGAGLIAAGLAVGYFVGAHERAVTVARRSVAVSPSPLSRTVEIAPAPAPPAPNQVLNSTVDKELKELRGELAEARADNAQLQAQYQARLQTPVAPAVASSTVPPPASPSPLPSSLPVSAPAAAPAELAQRLAEIEELRERLTAATARVTALERQAQQYQTLIDIERRRADQSTTIASFATDPGLRVIPFKGTELAPGAAGRVLIAGDQMLMVAAHLPALPQNRTYQMWLMRSKAPAIASAGTFNPDGSNSATLRFGDRALLSQVTAVAITDEPIGGSALPTGHKWVIGTNSGL